MSSPEHGPIAGRKRSSPDSGNDSDNSVAGLDDQPGLDQPDPRTGPLAHSPSLPYTPVALSSFSVEKDIERRRNILIHSTKRLRALSRSPSLTLSTVGSSSGTPTDRVSSSAEFWHPSAPTRLSDLSPASTSGLREPDGELDLQSTAWPRHQVHLEDLPDREFPLDDAEQVPQSSPDEISHHSPGQGQSEHDQPRDQELQADNDSEPGPVPELPVLNAMPSPSSPQRAPQEVTPRPLTGTTPRDPIANYKSRVSATQQARELRSHSEERSVQNFPFHLRPFALFGPEWSKNSSSSHEAETSLTTSAPGPSWTSTGSASHPTRSSGSLVNMPINMRPSNSQPGREGSHAAASAPNNTTESTASTPDLAQHTNSRPSSSAAAVEETASEVAQLDPSPILSESPREPGPSKRAAGRLTTPTSIPHRVQELAPQPVAERPAERPAEQPNPRSGSQGESSDRRPTTANVITSEKLDPSPVLSESPRSPRILGPSQTRTPTPRTGSSHDQYILPNRGEWDDEWEVLGKYVHASRIPVDSTSRDILIAVSAQLGPEVFDQFQGVPRDELCLRAMVIAKWRLELLKERVQT